MSAIVSFLWPSTASVVAELARRDWTSFACGTPAPPAVADAVRASGGHIRHLGANPALVERAERQADEAAVSMQGSLEHHLASVGAARGRGDRVVAAARDAYRRGLVDASLVIAALDAVASDEGVAAVLVNETETKNGRVPARWARAHGVPVFMVTHGANLNRYYTCTAGLEADRVYVYGERGIDAFLDQGEDRSKFAVTGNPGWDRYAAIRARRAERHGQPHRPRLVYATTWAAKLSAFGDSALQERITRAVLTACARLRAAGRAFDLTIKARPLDRMGEAAVTALAAAFGLGAVTWSSGPMDDALAEADLLVGYDTSAFVEAMLLDVPTLNLWSEPSWILGPPFAFNDGVPLVLADDVDELASTIDALLFDSATRERAMIAGRGCVGRLSLDGEGAAGRIATDIARLLPPPRPTWSSIGRSATASEPERQPHPALAAAIPPGASVVRYVADVADSERAGGADVVVLDGTLHRVTDPYALLRAVQTAAPAATIVVALDNARNVFLVRDLIARGVHNARVGGFAIGHLRRYTLEEAMTLLRESGYRVTGVSGVPDRRADALGTPPSGIFDLALPEMTVRGVNAESFGELTAATWVVVAVPA